MDAGLTAAGGRIVANVEDAGAGTRFAAGTNGGALVDTIFLADNPTVLPIGASLTPGAAAAPLVFVSAGGDGVAAIVSEVSGGVAALPGLAGFFLGVMVTDGAVTAATAAAGVAFKAPPVFGLLCAPLGDVDLCDPCSSGERGYVR